MDKGGKRQERGYPGLTRGAAARNRRELTRIGVILGATRGTRTPTFWSGGNVPPLLRAATRKITTQSRSFWF